VLWEDRLWWLHHSLSWACPCSYVPVLHISFLTPVVFLTDFVNRTGMLIPRARCTSRRATVASPALRAPTLSRTARRRTGASAERVERTVASSPRTRLFSRECGAQVLMHCALRCIALPTACCFMSRAMYTRWSTLHCSSLERSLLFEPFLLAHKHGANRRAHTYSLTPTFAHTLSLAPT
jgi:hypothetical protein